MKDNRDAVLSAMKEEYLRNILFFEHEAPKLAELLRKNLNDMKYNFDFSDKDHEGIINIFERSFFNLKNSYESYSRLVQEPVKLPTAIYKPITSVKKKDEKILLNESPKYQESCDF